MNIENMRTREKKLNHHGTPSKYETSKQFRMKNVHERMIY
jgi:hypothetical protein